MHIKMKFHRILTTLIVGLIVAICFFLVPDSTSHTFAQTQKKTDPDDIALKFKSGDIIFQQTASEQSDAIALATNSKYTHCGIIFKTEKSVSVLEALQPVVMTPLTDFIKRGVNGHFVVKRYQEGQRQLKEEEIQRLQEVSTQFIGKDYDSEYRWSDDQIYCSELIWKIYKRAVGIEIGQPQKLKEFDLSSELVNTKLQDLYGDEIPYEELIIAPAQLFNSSLLITVYSN